MPRGVCGRASLRRRRGLRWRRWASSTLRTSCRSLGRQPWCFTEAASPGFRSAIARFLASRIPEARLSILEGESAAPYLGDTEAAASTIDEFLGEAEERVAPWEAGVAAGTGREESRPGYANAGGLTAREVEVLRRLAGGKTNNEIAEELYVSVRTIERHIANIYGKIGTRGRANATAYALSHNLV